VLSRRVVKGTAAAFTFILFILSLLS